MARTHVFFIASYIISLKKKKRAREKEREKDQHMVDFTRWLHRVWKASFHFRNFNRRNKLSALRLNKRTEFPLNRGDCGRLSLLEMSHIEKMFRKGEEPRGSI